MSSPSPSIISVPDSESSDFAPPLSSGSGSGSAGSRSPRVRRVTAQTNKIKNSANAKTSIAVVAAAAVRRKTGHGSGTTPARSQAIGRGARSVKKEKVATNDQAVEVGALGDLEDAVGPSVRRPHSRAYHAVDQVAELQGALLDWFEDVREKRGMPWRKRYDPSLSMEEKGQRAYEIWVSEVMLQQTQVATVIAYWQRWIAKWPTIADLAKADVEEVNAAWRGLGYYRRARSLLAGAKTVMSSSKYSGRLPDDPAVLEKEIDGVGRYTAGAICSMAYGVRTPIVDGNIHRLLTRLLAVHAPQTAPGTIKFLWQAAEELVQRLEDVDGVAGDWNQALMELGSQVCKPAAPECAACPLQNRCKGYAEVMSGPPPAASDGCDLCLPIPSEETQRIPSVTVFPMRKEKKASREEEELVCVVEWQAEQGSEDRKWLFVKRPERGLLAGLFEPPTIALPAPTTEDQRLVTSLDLLDILDLPPGEIVYHINDHREIGKIQHIFSHINMTYHIHHVVLAPNQGALEAAAAGTRDRPPTPLQRDGRLAVWLDRERVEHTNIGTGVKKVWAEIYGSWGNFTPREKGKTKLVERKSKPKSKRSAGAAKMEADAKNGKIVKKIMMPMMPVRKVEVGGDQG
ncbi:hypothetical protein EHS25_005930 [Saitozyma podzolica]|uniref:Adenine DNA glycosylase n=1 Tax=Saitozyma podzolica TaxID=1890683 RepID=A0A427XTQ2_9TREE|nr:hypothetical protein EHS25_005930 [Saitozyma podzolica]